MSIGDRFIRKMDRLLRGAPVRERVVLKVVDSSARRPMKPGFLIGVYRSGTTLMRYVLDSHSRIAVPPETNFLYPAAELWRSEWSRKGLKGAGIDDEGLSSRLRDFAGGVLSDYAVAKGKSRWMDKTPAYIDVLDFLDFVFGGECRYLMLYRHGLDVAHSLATTYERGMLGGPPRDFAMASGEPPRIAFARYWAEQCEKMIAFEAMRPAQCLRVRYEDYSTEPEKNLRPVFSFLGEEWEPGVLDFNARPHDFGLQDSKIADTRTFDARIGTYSCWTDDEKRAAGAIIRPTMAKLGYEVSR
ncbi:MAG TPA: sulfotransferase [Thermodesulfobacteriota bacterium]